MLRVSILNLSTVLNCYVNSKYDFFCKKFFSVEQLLKSIGFIYKRLVFFVRNVYMIIAILVITFSLFILGATHFQFVSRVFH